MGLFVLLQVKELDSPREPELLKKVELLQQALAHQEQAHASEISYLEKYIEDLSNKNLAMLSVEHPNESLTEDDVLRTEVRRLNQVADET